MKDRVRLLLLRLLGFLLRRIAPSPAQQAQRILVIKPDHLGDVLLLTPALRALRQHLPHAQITLLVGPWSRDVVVHNPDVDVILTCTFPGFTRQAKGNVLQPYLLLLRTAWLLRAGYFDAALIARDDHWWGALLATLAGVPQRIGFAVPSVAPFLTTALDHDPDTHVTTQALKLVGALTGQPIDKRPPLRPPVTADDQIWAAHWLAHHDLDDVPLTAIHPGTGGVSKLWITTRWAEVGAALHRRGYRVILTGGPGEDELVAEIAARMTSHPMTLVGMATVGQLAALYERCALVLGVDSGPLHLAASVGTPTVVLFGPSNPQRYGPWDDPTRQQVLQSDLWCAPCHDLVRCPRGTAPSECMTLIAVGDVLKQVGRLAG